MRLRAPLGAFALVLLSATAARVEAAKLVSVSVLDKDYLVVHVLDGEVRHNEGGAESVLRYTPELSTSAAILPGSWRLTSTDDPAYGSTGRNPVAVHRKKKLSGHAQMEWVGSDYRYEYTYQHWIYLKLPSSLRQGMGYTLQIAAATNSDRGSASLTFDVYNTRSEAVHVNLAGYAPDAPHKAADLYTWLGDGGARDYSSFEGKPVYVYDVVNARAYPAGYVTFWRPAGEDAGWYNLTRSAVWNADFTGFDESGTYRIVVDGVGCSQDFRIAKDAYADPFRVSLRGYFYMRLGQQNPTAISPPPRTPLYIPGQSPSNTVVYLTTMQPWHPQWSTFASGDPWDGPNSWAPYRKAGSPTNPNAWGGHSDAYDWDRHLGHVSIIYDMLLPYVLTGGALADDDTGITESGNGIPDVVDEARNEVDFWLRLRDGAGYSHGLTNPNANNELFQAAPTAMAAWANAANAAMLAEAFRIAGRADLMASYRDAAVTAYNHANGLGDPMLDAIQDIGEGKIRARDLKMTAAAYLYNVTGDPAWEQVVNAESVCTSSVAELEDGNRNQVWATAAYLTTPRTVRFAALQANMRASVIHEAQTKEAGLIENRPSRRATDNRTGYFRTIQNVQRTILAHAVTESQAERDYFRKALSLEADWSLGRNPANVIEMSTATTPLAGKRSIEDMYTTGRDDGIAGLHPGHTPYLNLDDWWTGMVMGAPSRLYSGGYPADFKNSWPIGEGYFNSRWVWAHSEFTPQQTMRGKTALYAYLHALARGASTPPPPPPTSATLTVSRAGAGTGSVTSAPAGISCGSDCSEAYATGTTVTLQAAAAAGSVFAGWSGACSGAASCSLTMDAAQAVTATFAVVAGSRTYGNNGAPWAIAANGTTRIQAENFDTGGQGVAYQDSDVANSGGQYRNEGVDIESTSDTGGGVNVGWVVAGEWLGYTVDVAAAGNYDLRLRVARNPTGSSAVSVWSGGVNKTGSLAVPPTGGWQTWTDLTKPGLSLSAGQQVLRVAMDGGDFNLNWIELTAASSSGHALTVTRTGNGSGTVTSSPAGVSCGSDCSETYASGTTVTLTAAAAAGSTFTGWSGACTGAAACTLTMSAAQAVTATFASASGRCTHPASTACEWPVGPSAPTRIQAENFDAGGQGVAYHDSDAANSGGQYRAEGVDLEATTDAGAGFNVAWVVAGEWLEYTVNVAAAGTYDLKLRTARQAKGSSAVRVLFGGVDKTGDLTVPSTARRWTDVTKTGLELAAGRQTVRVLMVGSQFKLNWLELTPVSVAPQATLSVSRTGTGSGNVVSSPAGIDCGSSCSASYASDATVTLSATPATGSTFSGWSGACAGTGSCTVTMGGDRAVSASFATGSSTTHTLTVSRGGTGSGTVASSPAGISCGSDCSEPYSAGTSVTLTASAAAGSTFSGWSGACSGSGACTVTMSTAQSVLAVFSLPTRTTYGAGGSPWAIGATGTTRIQAENYDTGGEGVAYHDNDSGNNGGQYRNEGVDIEASADAGGGYNVGWVNGGEWLEYTLDVATAGTYELRLRVARQPGGNATASVSFGGVDRTGTLSVPSTGGWQAWADVVKPVSLSAGRQLMRISMGGGEFNVNWFELARPTTVTLSKSGNGSGTVTAAPAGIDCGSDCGETYPSGTVVTLTATPATGSAFAGWGGACAVATTTCTLTVDGPLAVTAAFDTSTVIYGDSLESNWQSWSWGSTIDFGATAPVKAGGNAINVTYDGAWAGLSLRRDTALGTSGYAALKFWVHGGTGADKTLGVTTHAEDTSGESTRVLVTAVANTWTEITVPLSGLGYPAAIKRVTIMNFTPDPQPMVSFDEIRLVAISGPLSTLSVSKAGSGFGSVTSWPPGISCGSDCGEGYAGDASVTLTPWPAVGSSFSGWSGACTGNGACTVPMSAARWVTANFTGTTVAGALRWVGRVDASNPAAVRFAWQGAGLVATVSGSTIAVKLQTTNAPSAVYQVVVDGLPGARFSVPESAIETVTLASGLTAGEHVVELYRDTEGMYGVSTFWGFAQGTVVGSPALNGRLVEVVGDAISAGYGNLGSEPHPGWVANPACTWSADNSSWFRTYGAVAGRALGAEVSTIARSGWGLTRDGSGSSANTLPSVYDNAVGTNDPGAWGFAPQASVVVVNLGTSDIATGDPGTAFEAAYVDFVRRVRGRYPNAWIFLTIGSTLGEPNLGTMKTRLANVVAAVNDGKVASFDLGQQDLGWDGSVPTGCDWHPSASDHARMAEILKAQLKARLGW